MFFFEIGTGKYSEDINFDDNMAKLYEMGIIPFGVYCFSEEKTTAINTPIEKTIVLLYNTKSEVGHASNIIQF